MHQAAPRKEAMSHLKRVVMHAWSNVANVLAKFHLYKQPKRHQQFVTLSRAWGRHFRKYLSLFYIEAVCFVLNLMYAPHRYLQQLTPSKQNLPSCPPLFIYSMLTLNCFACID